MTGLAKAGAIRGARFTPDEMIYPALAGLVLDIIDAACPVGTTSVFIAADIPGRGGQTTRHWFRDDEVKPARTATRPDTPISGHAKRIRDGLAKLHESKREPKRIPMTATQQLNALATSIATDRSISLSAALKEAAAQHPDIAERWRNETTDAPEAVSLSATAETGTAFALLCDNYARENRVDLRTAVHAVGRKFPALARERD